MKWRDRRLIVYGIDHEAGTYPFEHMRVGDYMRAATEQELESIMAAASVFDGGVFESRRANATSFLVFRIA